MPSNYNPKPYKGRRTDSHKASKKKQSCCPMVAAVRSVKDGKFRLAFRYARWSAQLIAARVIA